MATTTTTTDLPSPPFHKIPNINNLRDCALFPLRTPTGRIRANLLFRSAEPSKLRLEDWRALHALGVAHVFDLRSLPEVIKNASISQSDSKDGAQHEGDSNAAAQPAWIADMHSAGVHRSWVPVFAEADYSPEGIAKRYVKYMDEDVAGFVAAYREILGAGGAAYRAILKYLVDIPPAGTAADDHQTPRGVLVHCTAGKDRTGIFFGVLFDFLGVERQAIADEYNLTELGLLPVRDAVVERLMLSPAFQNYMVAQARGKPLSVEEIARYFAVQDGESGGGDAVELSDEVKAKGREAGLRMVSAKKESMLGALDMVDRVFGGSEQYLRVQCGLGDGELDALRRVLVVSE